MATIDEFVPRWASPPGDTIRESLEDLRLSVDEFAREIDVDVVTAEGLLQGSTHISLSLARRLSDKLGGSPTFWLTREARFRESLEWVEADQWVSLLRHKDLVDLGWVESAGDWHERVVSCMTSFGARSPAELNARRSVVSNAWFRAKPGRPQHDAAITAWVLKVEAEAEVMACAAWNPDGFRGSLPQMVGLSRTPDPARFVPELARRCSTMGVAVVVVRAPRDCPVSGVSLVLPSGTRVIGLSGRYLADDHFWFTFLHEAAHLLLHDAGSVFVDDIDPRQQGDMADGPEADADRFASGILLPQSVRLDLPNRPSPRAVHGLAHRIGVSPGVIVGQLQHIGLLPFNSALNRLKHRYSWNGADLIRGTA